jgi:hypothetical protein
MFDELDAQVLRRDLRKSAKANNEYVINIDDIEAAAQKLGDEPEDEVASPAVEYWEPEARKQRAREATALRAAKHRKKKNGDGGS